MASHGDGRIVSVNISNLILVIIILNLLLHNETVRTEDRWVARYIGRLKTGALGR